MNPSPDIYWGPALSKRAAGTLQFLRDYHGQHSYMPTTREIATGCGFTTQTQASEALAELERKGVIFRLPSPRAIRILKP